jgi:hypothetical protein
VIGPARRATTSRFNGPQRIQHPKWHTRLFNKLPLRVPHPRRRRKLDGPGELFQQGFRRRSMILGLCGFLRVCGSIWVWRRCWVALWRRLDCRQLVLGGWCRGWLENTTSLSGTSGTLEYHCGQCVERASDSLDFRSFASIMMLRNPSCRDGQMNPHSPPSSAAASAYRAAAQQPWSFHGSHKHPHPTM